MCLYFEYEQPMPRLPFRARLKSMFLRPIWARVSFLYGTSRPGDEDYWAMVDGELPASEWPFQTLGTWSDVEIHPFDEESKCSIVMHDNWDVYISEIGQEGPLVRIGALSRQQAGICVSFDNPMTVSTKLVTTNALSGFERVVRALEPLHRKFESSVLAMGEQVSSVEEALGVVQKALRHRILPS